MQEKREGHRRVSTPKLVAAVLGIMLVLSLVIATLLGPPSPAGKYYNEGMASEGLAYFEFKDGTVTEVVPLNVKLSEGVMQRQVGKYFRRGEKWILSGMDGEELVLRTGLFGIEFEGFKTDGSAARFPRYWFPR